MELDGEADRAVDDHVVQPSGRDHLTLSGRHSANLVQCVLKDEAERKKQEI